MKIFRFGALCCLSLLAGNITAQERTAGSTVETQMTWSMLSDQIKAVDVKVNAANSRIDAAVECGKKGMVYAPGAPGAVGGCIEASRSDNQTVNVTYLSNNLATVTNNLTTVTNNLAATTTNVSKIIACNQQGKLFNGSTCATIAPTTPAAPNCSSRTVAPTGGACPTGAPITATSTCHQGSGGRGGWDVPCTIVTGCVVTSCN